LAKPHKIKKLSPHDPPEIAAVRILQTRLKEYYSHWPDPDHTPTAQELHNLRISGKRLRYSAESLREFYPDHLALLIQLLKNGQDLLGDIQDCATQRASLEQEISRLKRRSPKSKEIAALAELLVEYDQRHSQLFSQFHEIWRGFTIKEFRKSLKALISRTIQPTRTDRTMDDLYVAESLQAAVSPSTGHD
jgi:CHAD domain-containing protein